MNKFNPFEYLCTGMKYYSNILQNLKRKNIFYINAADVSARGNTLWENHLSTLSYLHSASDEMTLVLYK